MTKRLPHTRVGIKAFTGIVIEDSWVQINRNFSFREGTPTALVVGSALEFDDAPRGLLDRNTLEEYCRTVGEILARSEYNLVNGACPGLPDAAMAAFNSSPRSTLSLGLSAYLSPKEHLGPKDFAPDGFPLSADITVFCGTGFEILNVLNTLCADLLIVVGGGIGTLLEAATAVEQELTVLCLEPSGGISEELSSLLSRYVASFKSFDVRVCKDLHEMETHLSQFRDAFLGSKARSRLSPLVKEILEAERDSEAVVTYEIASDARSISYKYRETEIQLFDPVLMTDRMRISRVPMKGEQLLAALESRSRRYRFREIEVITAPSENSIVWGPNIDTLIMLRALLAFEGELTDSRILEIGFGSGLISLWLSSLGSKTHVTGIDVDPASLLCAEWNCSRLSLSERCDFLNSDYQSGLSRSFDFLVCNPPYLPNNPSSHYQASAYGGCDLLNSVLENYRENLEHGGRCLITASSASFLSDRFKTNFDRLSCLGKLRLVRTERVPLKVYGVLDEPEWIGFLTDGGGVFRRPDEEYAFWHDVMVIELTL
jgi:tRNA1(Val) A37 N6-methylase TrmN6/predicted Rossmann-fold nucleotide-binding protein